MADLAGALRRYRPEEIGVLASPQMSNEDLFALQRIAGQLGIRAVDHRRAAARARARTTIS